VSSQWWSAWTPESCKRLAARALADGLLVGVERVVAGDDLALCPALLGDDGIERVLVVGLSTAGRACVAGLRNPKKSDPHFDDAAK